MVTLLFAHDNQFIMDDKGRLFSGGGFSDGVFRRYLAVCERLVVVGRYQVIESPGALGYEPIMLSNVSFIPMENPNSIQGLFQRSKIRSKMDEIVRNCDGVIGRASALGNMAIASAKKLGKPYVREVVGCSFEPLWYHGSWLGKLYAPYSFLRARRLTREAPYVVYVTESFLQKRYPTRGKWINCSNVELDDFDDKILERRLRRIDSKTDGEPLILGTIGAVHVRYKGQEGVIRALAKLRQIGLDGFRYEIVGGGDQSYLRKIARKYGVADQVDFLGRMTRKEVFQWLDKIDLYIQPSKTEGLPRALIEAMSRGLPCLGTRVGGIPELLTDECLFSRRKTAQALVARLSGLSKDWMKQQAKRNFMESQEYAREAIETRRREFLEQFVSSITACGDSCPSNK